MNIRKKHSGAFKFKVAFEALTGGSVTAICQAHGVAPGLVYKWKKDLQKNGARVFEDLKIPAGTVWEKERAKLLQQIGQLTVDLDFLKKVVGS